MVSVLKDKSYSFAVRIVKLVQWIQKEQNEYILSRQILKSGTAIGALVCEAEFAQSKLDYISKLNIALKEANETCFWLNLLKDTNYIEENLFISLDSDCRESIALLVSMIKTLKSKR